jgi:hypothetical protein
LPLNRGLLDRGLCQWAARVADYTSGYRRQTQNDPSLRTDAARATRKALCVRVREGTLAHVVTQSRCCYPLLRIIEIAACAQAYRSLLRGSESRRVAFWPESAFLGGAPGTTPPRFVSNKPRLPMSLHVYIVRL